MPIKLGIYPYIIYLCGMNKIKCIYSITNTTTGKMYIGSTLDYKSRMKSHRTYLNKGTHSSKKLQASWNKYGSDVFLFDIIEELTENCSVDIIMLEEIYILKNNTIKNGYNIYLPYSEQKKTYSSLEKISNSSRDNLLAKGPFKLKQMSTEEWIEKRKVDPTYKVPKIKHNKYFTNREEYLASKVKTFREYNLEFNYIATHVGIRPTATKLGLDSKQLSNTLKYNGVTHFGSKLKRVKDYIFILDSLVTDNIFKDVVKERKPKVIKERIVRGTPISLIKDGEIMHFENNIEAISFLSCNKNSFSCLKKGIKNKGRGQFSKVTHIKGWSIYSSTSV